ncbi:hypothetical protein M409DRAFT_52516 [Zasmidium cellare ATCC 36951]|uniref:NAD-dependent epimerase/dehydratase domain-containing protein n=1 Tax=Zasmidium cellare ATCC 36951 TaxID=1080233 RepID=A0A6A6CSW4_ZASCE|nr:uncharacterized protein M409DRAFT_52516 [Zasmidium cellare ATCC 36951]KAF2169250.1 hypothetical protein M409DRAFT_52516 [Zasmidium cellare ATCC 36951]
MPPPRIFVTGATGYIGGTVLDSLVTRHPEYSITVLLRNVPERFAEQYPNVRIVHGDYDSADVIIDAVSKVDIVIHNGNSDREPSLNAIVEGLVGKEETSFLIHLSGTGVLSDWREAKYHGKLNPKIWSDIDDIDEIWSRPGGELHRNTEKILQAASKKHGDKLKIAVMCPPDIYGRGHGPGRRRSAYFPFFWKDIMTVGAPFYAEDGANTRSFVHIDDLMEIYLRVVEAAAAGGAGAGWGKEGYYFATTQEASQIDIATATAQVLRARGAIQQDKPLRLPKEQVAGFIPYSGLSIGTYLYMSNSRTRADRAHKLFEYHARQSTLWEVLETEIADALEY